MRKIKLFIWSLLALVLIGTSVLLVNILEERSSIYGYDTGKNYTYDFNQSRAHMTDLEIRNGSIQLKGSGDVKGTAFLKVDIQTTFLGKYLQPSIELKAGKLSYIQYFERGAEGIRYINISSLITEDQTDISLKQNYISLKEKSVKLISFADQNLSEMKILVLSPHPDDAEIAAYGLYSDNSKRSYIVTITAGDAGRFKYNEIYKDKVRHYLKKGELRTFDSITVPLLGSVPSEQILNLGFFDLSLQKMFHDKDKEVGGFYTNILDINTYRKQNLSGLATGLKGNSSWNSLVENIKYLLEIIKPDIIVTPYPALDTHPDHKLTTVALIEALKQSKIKKGSLYLYSNHFLYNEYYPYGKRGGIISLPPHFNDDIYFDSIYSHPLSANKQKDKLFALEAMHDLRLDTEWRFPLYPAKLLEAQIEKRIKGQDRSYFKRSVRSNELFFVIDINNIYDENIFDRLKGKI